MAQSIYLFRFRVWPQRQGPFADPSDLQRELAILTGFGPCHRASSEDFASYLVSLPHPHPIQIRTCDHCLGSRCPNHRLAVRIWEFSGFLFAYERGTYHPVGSRHPARLIGFLIGRFSPSNQASRLYTPVTTGNPRDHHPSIHHSPAEPTNRPRSPWPKGPAQDCHGPVQNLESYGPVQVTSVPPMSLMLSGT